MQRLDGADEDVKIQASGEYCHKDATCDSFSQTLQKLLPWNQHSFDLEDCGRVRLALLALCDRAEDRERERYKPAEMQRGESRSVDRRLQGEV